MIHESGNIQSSKKREGPLSCRKGEVFKGWKGAEEKLAKNTLSQANLLY